MRFSCERVRSSYVPVKLYHTTSCPSFTTLRRLSRIHANLDPFMKMVSFATSNCYSVRPLLRCWVTTYFCVIPVRIWGYIWLLPLLNNNSFVNYWLGEYLPCAAKNLERKKRFADCIVLFGRISTFRQNDPTFQKGCREECAYELVRTRTSSGQLIVVSLLEPLSDPHDCKYRCRSANSLFFESPIPETRTTARGGIEIHTIKE